MTNTVEPTFTLAQIVGVIGGITAIGAFIAWVIKPFQRLDKLETRVDDLEEARKERKETDQYMMSALNALVNHMIDGNGISELKKVRDEYQQQIIKHHQ